MTGKNSSSKNSEGFRASGRPGQPGGFTLIELLTVIAVLGVLASIAIPAFLGQRDKAKVNAVRSSAKGAVAEIHSIVDAYVSAEPFLILDSSNAEICVQDASPPTGKTCQSIYSQGADGTYGSIDDIIEYVIAYHQGKQEKSPYGNWWLFVKGAATGNMGEIVISNSTERNIRIKAYASDTSNPVFNTTVPQQ